MHKEFKQFLLRGNVVDLAVGVIIGTAFGAVISSIVSDILLPLIGALFKLPVFGYLTITINEGIIPIGRFIDTVVYFLLIATAVFFFIVKPMNMLIARSRKEPPADPTTKKCSECLSEVPIQAKRCSHCTQVI
jgi:large conductance mechanosensitive channel